MGRISRKAMTCGEESTRKHDGEVFSTSTFEGTYCSRELDGTVEGDGEEGIPEGDVGVVGGEGYAFAIVQKGHDCGYISSRS
jgi:hypothetical protein